MVTKKKPVSPEEFVRLWQKAQGLQQLADKLGVQPGSLSCRASDYRKKGVPLKHLENPGGRRAADWEALKRIAQETQS